MTILITGGAGFIGCNLADHHLQNGEEVIIFDNLSRKGSDRNLEWLRSRHGDRLGFVRGDIRDFEQLENILTPDVSRLYHMAGQVAVTTSVQDPREDFEINALGTFNVLEAVRAKSPDAVVVYASTNKVFGGMEDLEIVEDATRYRYRDHASGISENRVIDFHSPYGCSKGCGDQYVRDYARIYGLKTLVMRQSCIYGPRQMGVEDQGWIAHFCISASLGRSIRIYGDGKQVRDVLWVTDLIRAYELAVQHIDTTAGQIYNLGGGPEHTMSIWREFGPLLENLAGRDIRAVYEDWRPGDQLVYISDIRKAERDFHWQPQVSVREGVERLWTWVCAHQELFV